ncbi:DUF1127 domain-containing protein [Aliirhizobium smilacinae]|uniref:DUF1127 domain-containing protein n=1 Tax=Aliirhizobium smilacinae TaxID=1395944 RepID=A0A5C4XEZ8_9HYPH|nr:DUF1127 domain-containing protein [Rhizobium smilacinae]TNM62037.1 DUF1127 domain-containing protein [Rhizobium smilacinae]
MRKYDEYLATIDTMYPDRYEREEALHVAGDLLQPAKMPVRAGLVAGLIDVLGNWAARRKGRQMLRDMGDEQLQDIGVTRICATREAARSRFLA